jgi:hypothetical protein
VPFSLNNDEKRQVADAMVAAFEQSQYERDLEQSEEFVQIIGSLDAKQNNALVACFINKLRHATDASYIRSLLPILEAFPIFLAGDDAAKRADEICNAVNDPQNEWTLEYWYRVLAKIDYQLSEEQRHRTADPIIAQLKKLQAPSPDADHYGMGRRDELESWLSALAKIPGGPTNEDRRQARELALTILSSASYILENYPFESVTVIGLLPGTDKHTLIELLKWPTLQERSRDAVITVLEKQTKQSFRNDIWRAARWAESSGCDVSSPPSRNGELLAEPQRR